MADLAKNTLAKTFAAVLASCVVGSILLRSVIALGTLLPGPFRDHADLFIEGAANTLKLTAISGAFGLALGLLMGVATSQTQFALLRWLVRGLSAIIRGTPLLVQILFCYYATPWIFAWILRQPEPVALSEFNASILALTLNSGAYNGETFHAGLVAVPKGQREAAHTLGLSQLQTFNWILLPQALRMMLPPLLSQLAALTKDSSLASVIGFLELSLAGNRVSSETFDPVPTLTTVAILYLMLTAWITGTARWIEQLLQPGKTGEIK